jgi:hypothetical protein
VLHDTGSPLMSTRRLDYAEIDVSVVGQLLQVIPGRISKQDSSTCQVQCMQFDVQHMCVHELQTFNNYHLADMNPLMHKRVYVKHE